MNTLEEFRKRLDNLLDFVDENSDELIHKYKIGMYLSCLYIKDRNPYDDGLIIGNAINTSCSISSFLKKHPEFIELFETAIEVSKKLANDDRSKRM